jgi:hypothetical protein
MNVVEGEKEGANGNETAGMLASSTMLLPWAGERHCCEIAI